MDFFKKHEAYVNKVIELALEEDIGPGDVTTDIIIPESAVLKGVLRAKEDGIICGLPAAKMAFHKLNKDIKIVLKKKDGDRVNKWDIIGTLKGSARAILMAERTALNLLQKLSGIATASNKFAEMVKPYGVTILDTRKTTAGLRLLEKYAVKTGGATNHRMGLYDMVLIKDNHHEFIHLEKAVADCRRYIPKSMKIEVEVHNLEMLEYAMTAEPDIIMLDNMDLETMDKALARMKSAGCLAKVEISGGINLENIKEIASRKVDYISIGSITHSAPALDISLQLSK